MFEEHQPNDYELAPELLAFRRQLGNLDPTAPRIDRDQLMWSAGRAAALRAQVNRVAGTAAQQRSNAGWASSKLWPAATATMTAATLLLSTMLLWQQAPQSVAEKPANTPPGVATAIRTTADEVTNTYSLGPPLSPPTASGYIGIRNIALARGIGAADLEPSNDASGQPRPSTPIDTRQLLDELLPAEIRQSS